MLYVERCQQHRWRGAEVTFTCPEAALCRRWVGAIGEQLAVIGTTSRRLQHTRGRDIFIFINVVVVVVFSQQTQAPAGLHQPVQREAARTERLRAAGGAAVRPGRRLHARHRYPPPPPSLPVPVPPSLIRLRCLLP